MPIKIKKLEWECAEYKDGAECHDKQFGFYINENIDDDPDFRFKACWGEGDAENFSTLEEAKEWCQKELSEFVMSMIVSAPPDAEELRKELSEAT